MAETGYKAKHLYGSKCKIMGKRSSFSKKEAVSYDSAEKYICLPDTLVDPSKLAEQSNTMDKINAALEKLPLELKTAFVLSEIEGLDYKEIAKTVGGKEISVTEEEVQDSLNYLQKTRAKFTLKNESNTSNLLFQNVTCWNTAMNIWTMNNTIAKRNASLFIIFPAGRLSIISPRSGININKYGIYIPLSKKNNTIASPAIDHAIYVL